MSSYSSWQTQIWELFWVSKDMKLIILTFSPEIAILREIHLSTIWLEIARFRLRVSFWKKIFYILFLLFYRTWKRTSSYDDLYSASLHLTLPYGLSATVWKHHQCRSAGDPTWLIECLLASSMQTLICSFRINMPIYKMKEFWWSSGWLNCSSESVLLKCLPSSSHSYFARWG